MNLGILRPYETDRFLRILESPIQRSAEEEEAYKNIEKAKEQARSVYALTQENPNWMRIPKRKQVAMLQESTHSILDAEQRARDVWSRNEYIIRFI